jgi:hypothetical protein
MCIRVANLRKEGYANLREWMDNPNNVYVGRRGRIFIHTGGEKEIFHYTGSKWANPFTLKEYTLEESLRLYEKHLEDNGLVQDLEQLRGKTLGCFCDQTGDCHAKILSQRLDAL